MHIFTTTRDGFKERRRKIIISLSAVYLPILIILIYSLPYDASTGEGYGRIILTIVFVGVMLLISGVATIRRQKKIFESFRLIVDENSITREQHNTPTITISRDKVREILTFGNGMLCIIGESKLNPISVPSQIEGREELHRLLAEIKPFTSKKYGLSMAYLQILLGFAVIIALFAGTISDDRIVSSISGTLLATLIIAGIILTRLNKNIDKRTKRISYVGIIAALAIISNVIIRWING